MDAAQILISEKLVADKHVLLETARSHLREINAHLNIIEYDELSTTHIRELQLLEARTRVLVADYETATTCA